MEKVREGLDANGCYNVLNEVKTIIEGGGSIDQSQLLTKLSEVQKFSNNKLPKWNSDDYNLEKSEYGVYSPAHVLSNVVQLVIGLIQNHNGKVDLDLKKTIITSLDQAMRLISKAEISEWLTIRPNNERREFKLPNLVEVPRELSKQAESASTFKIKLNEYIKRRKVNAKLTNEDVTLLQDMIKVVKSVYNGVSVDEKIAKETPFARELIMINLTLLLEQIKLNLGKTFGLDGQKHLQVIQLVRALFNYNKKAEMEVQLRPNMIHVGPPKIMAMPDGLKT